MADTVGRGDAEPNPFAEHRLRIITVSAANRITGDAMQSWSSIAVTSAFTGELLRFPAAEIPSGVIERLADGREHLRTVDGFTLHLDGAGGLLAYDDVGDPIQGPGIFMVVEVNGPRF
ncbi:hypothetical protein [Actinomadura sp. 21ATH]|uniref:hypothetical protein n=1 Tax=Actinomadura sp. 21ATH TaxID=1735444 RepID=UPI0035C04808